jgi:hypothetical protein
MRRALPVLGLAALLAAGAGCDLIGGRKPPAKPAAKSFPRPIFDGLHLGMTRAEAMKSHPLRSTLTAAGRDRRVWAYTRPGEYNVELTFEDPGGDARLSRIDVHFTHGGVSSDTYIARFERLLGPPDVRRKKAAINAYGDAWHEQFDTVWSDSRQYVFLTERVPAAGRGLRHVFFLTVKKRELAPTGPPTGYVPPPPPKDKDGKPVDEEIF